MGHGVVLRQPRHGQEFLFGRQQAERVTYGGAAGEPRGVSGQEPAQLLPHMAMVALGASRSRT